MLLALLLAPLMAPSEAGAVCIGSDDAEVQQLVREIGRQPLPVLARIEQAQARTPAADLRRRTWLRSARYLALGMAEQDDLQLAPDTADAQAHLPAGEPALLMLRVFAIGNLQDKAAMHQAALAIEPALYRLPASTPARVCALAQVAHVLVSSGHPADAFAAAAEAYRDSSSHKLAWEHAEAASVLAQVVRLQGDSDYAVELNTKALAFFLPADMHDLVSNELSMRAWARQGQRDYEAARIDFRDAIEAGRRAGNAAAVAHAESGLCHVLLEMKNLAEARPACDSAYKAYLERAEHGEAWMPAFQARLLLEDGQPTDALALLNPLLADANRQTRSFLHMAHELRARARAALGDHRGAYADMQASIGHFKESDRQERERSIAVGRARFKTEQLAQDLTLKTREHARSVRINWLIGGLALLSLLLMAAIIAVMAGHRRTYRRLAYSDALTGVANRRFTEERLGQMLAHARARSEPLVLVLLDLDHFKSCNDRWGHDAGDAALRLFADTVTRLVRPGDLFGRWGGEEFVLVLPATDLDAAITIVERLRSSAAQVVLPLSPGYPLQFSAGLAPLQPQVRSRDELLRAADTALYEAKQAGRNRSNVAQPAPRPAALATAAP